MMTGKSNALARMYAAGLSAQSSVYGRTIPVGYGVARHPGLLLIWQNELRKGSSGKKAKKKGQTTYIENVDFLIGHNPIAGALQVWHDQATRLPLNFLKQTSTPSGGSLTISDPNFYFVVAVTVDIPYSVTYNDYGGQGSQSFSGTYERPLWNINYAGPDPTNGSAYRWSPWVYQWVPYSGNVIGLPFNGPDLAWGSIWVPTVNVYYAALDANGFKSQGKFKGEGSIIPITALRLQWEPELGDGNEFVTPGDFSSQQVIYPMYAGLGSNSLDLGTSGAVPVVRPEIVWPFSLYGPRGDADFMDMYEDIFKSGPAQNSIGSSAAFGDIHHGLGCLDWPGAIQKLWTAGLEAFDWGAPGFPLNNEKGNFIVTVYSDAGSSLTGASDTLGNSYTNVFASGGGFYAGYAPITTGGFPNAVSIAGRGGVLSGGNDWDQTILEIAGLDTLDSATYYNGTAGAVNLNITTTNKIGEPCFIVVATRVGPGLGASPPAPLHWNALTRGTAWHWVDSRLVRFPGTYNYKIQITSGTTWQTVVYVFKNSQPVPFPNPLPNLLDDGPTGTMQNTRDQCRANGLIGSMILDSQAPAKQFLEDINYASNSAAVWSGFTLKVIPWSEVSTVGNGANYKSPTSDGPIWTFSENDFIAGPNEAPISIERKARIDAPNLQQIQHANRDSDYNQIVTAQPDPGAISFYGVRKDSPKVLTCIQEASVARMLLGIQTRVKNTLLNNYKWKAPAKFKQAEAMDLGSIPLSVLMPDNPQNPPSGSIPVRFLSVSEDDKFQLDIEAEDFVYGLHAPVAVPVTTPNPYSSGIGVDPGPVNPPVIFLATPELNAGVSGSYIRVGLSGADPDIWGGAATFVSTDGGLTYSDQPIAVQTGATQMGVVVNSPSWPLTSDPDTSSDLLVDLTESLGTLNNFGTADENAGASGCYVEGGTSLIPYEMMSYAVATLTSANKYTLSASSGNFLRRGLFGTPISAHATGSKFAFFGGANSGAKFTNLLVDPAWYGKTIFFKFASFNVFGAGLESLAGLTAYPFTIPFPSGGDVNAEVPAGAVDGVNTTFSLSVPPSPAILTQVYINGVKQLASSYSISGSSVIFSTAPAIGDVVYCWYRTDGIAFLYGTEIPGGAINGSNTAFTLSFAPNPQISLMLWLNGIMLKQGLDYTLSGTSITMTSAPLVGDTLDATYRADGSPLLNAEVPSGSGFFFTVAHTPNPSVSLLLYRNGVEQIPGIDYTISGPTITLTTTIGTDSLLAFYEF